MKIMRNKKTDSSFKVFCASLALFASFLSPYAIIATMQSFTRLNLMLFMTYLMFFMMDFTLSYAKIPLRLVHPARNGMEPCFCSHLRAAYHLAFC